MIISFRMKNLTLFSHLNVYFGNKNSRFFDKAMIKFWEFGMTSVSHHFLAIYLSKVIDLSTICKVHRRLLNDLKIYYIQYLAISRSKATEEVELTSITSRE